MTANNSTIRVGVAGLGRSGWNMHVGAFVELPELYKVTAVCDLDPERLIEAETTLGCRTTSSYAELLAGGDIELMVVATPSHHHLDDALAAMRAGMDVMVEKPMAMSLAAVDQMIAVAQETGRLLTVNQNYRYAADFLAVKNVVDSGVLGKLVMIRLAQHHFKRRWDWQTLQEYGGGILNNHGAHIVDWALQLIGDSKPELVMSQLLDTPMYAGDANNHAKLLLQPKDGPLVDIELTSACAFPQQNVMIMGTQGTLISNRKEVRWKYYRPDEAPPMVLNREPSPVRQYDKEELPVHEEMVTPNRHFQGELQQLYRDLHATMREGAPLAITAASVRDLMAILDACHAKGTVKVE